MTMRRSGRGLRAPGGRYELTPLTARQRQIALWIRAFIGQYGMPPTVREIGEAHGIGSPNGVVSILDALIRKGVIEVLSFTSRGIRLKGARWRFEYEDSQDGERLKAALRTEASS